MFEEPRIQVLCLGRKQRQWRYLPQKGELCEDTLFHDRLWVCIEDIGHNKGRQWGGMAQEDDAVRIFDATIRGTQKGKHAGNLPQNWDADHISTTKAHSENIYHKSRHSDNI